MRKHFTCLLALAAIVLTASTCEKMEPGDYRDYLGHKINILGAWTLTEVQIRTAGVIESRPFTPQSLMEFAEKGLGYTKEYPGLLALRDLPRRRDDLHQRGVGKQPGAGRR